MLAKSLNFIIFSLFLEFSQGSTQTDLRQYVHDLNVYIRDHFNRFEAEIQNLKKESKLGKKEIQTLKEENALLRNELKSIQSSKHNVNCSRKCESIPDVINNDKRGIISYGTIAFSAVLTPNFDKSIGTHHVFIYDHVESNIGGAYNSRIGIFTAPIPGTYAFLWTIFTEGRYDIDGQFGEIETELVVNSKRRGYAFTDTEVHADDDQATGFVIVQLNQGDVVYVRSIGGPQGTFQHAYHGQWTFSGWKIA